MRITATQLTTESQISVVGEPLLRFPFMDFVKDPCALVSLSSASSLSDNLSDELMAGNSSSNGQPRKSPIRSPLRTLASDGTSLSQQALDFIEPIRNLYNNRPKFASRAERIALLREFNIIMLEVRHRTDIMYPRSVGFLNLC